jgi:hypothetical protein
MSRKGRPKSEPHDEALKRAFALVDQIRSIPEKPPHNVVDGILIMLAEEVALAAIQAVARAVNCPIEQASRTVINRITQRLEQRPS